jgi:CubicO group peptidase (beta-lactamase class C family)
MNNKKNFGWILTLLLFAVLSQYTFAKTSQPQLAEDYLQQYFNGSALVAKAGKILLRKGYGYADFEKGISNTPATVFKLASLTKQFTAMGILILEEKGKLSTKDTISKFLPDYPGGDQITIHHLLTHTSGITEFFFPDNCPNPEDLKRYHPTEDLIALFKNKPLGFTPGKRFQYCNSNYVLLGYIIEIVSGIKYEDFIRQFILVPLDMANSGFEADGNPLKNEALGYEKIKPDPVKVDFYDMSIAYGAGDLCSTVDDLYKWDQALYTEKLVKKETLQKMFTTYSEASYGYGWSGFTSDNSTFSYMNHTGSIFGFSTFIYRDIKNHAVIILLSNEQGQNLANYLGLINYNG